MTKPLGSRGLLQVDNSFELRFNFILLICGWQPLVTSRPPTELLWLTRKSPLFHGSLTGTSLGSKTTALKWANCSFRLATWDSLSWRGLWIVRCTTMCSNCIVGRQQSATPIFILENMFFTSKFNHILSEIVLVLIGFSCHGGQFAERLATNSHFFPMVTGTERSLESHSPERRVQMNGAQVSLPSPKNQIVFLTEWPLEEKQNISQSAQFTEWIGPIQWPNGANLAILFTYLPFFRREYGVSSPFCRSRKVRRETLELGPVSWLPWLEFNWIRTFTFKLQRAWQETFRPTPQWFRSKMKPPFNEIHRKSLSSLTKKFSLKISMEADIGERSGIPIWPINSNVN